MSSKDLGEQRSMQLVDNGKRKEHFAQGLGHSEYMHG